MVRAVVTGCGGAENKVLLPTSSIFHTDLVTLLQLLSGKIKRITQKREAPKPEPLIRFPCPRQLPRGRFNNRSRFPQLEHGAAHDASPPTISNIIIMCSISTATVSGSAETINPTYLQHQHHINDDISLRSRGGRRGSAIYTVYWYTTPRHVIITLFPGRLFVTLPSSPLNPVATVAGGGQDGLIARRDKNTYPSRTASTHKLNHRRFGCREKHPAPSSQHRHHHHQHANGPTE